MNYFVELHKSVMDIADIMVAIFKDEADEDIQEVRKDKNNIHEYQANINEIVGTFKDRFVFAVNELSPTQKDNQITTD